MASQIDTFWNTELPRPVYIEPNFALLQKIHDTQPTTESIQEFLLDKYNTYLQHNQPILNPYEYYQPDMLQYWYSKVEQYPKLVTFGADIHREADLFIKSLMNIALEVKIINSFTNAQIKTFKELIDYRVELYLQTDEQELKKQKSREAVRRHREAKYDSSESAEAIRTARAEYYTTCQQRKAAYDANSVVINSTKLAYENACKKRAGDEQTFKELVRQKKAAWDELVKLHKQV